MKADELRQKYLEFFKSKGHTIILSASLVPENDPSVLFTTAGMQQFKEFYIDPEKTSNSRVATIQKCVRTGDIDEVGDKTHLTFFEMLGNFSFGYPDKQDSYFEKETISYAWEFLTKSLGIDKKRIHSTYFKGENGVAEDKESLEVLEKIDGMEKIIPQGWDDNFWSLGTENSPGGPTVEFYVDGIEVWNCVFNEYVFKRGSYQLANKKGVDTGMGLERLLAVLDGKETVFDTGLFQMIIQKIEEISGKKYEGNEKSFRIIADHVKAATFIISDGVTPLNVGRGYILRRLIRRAIRYGKQLGIEKNFTKQIAEAVIEIYRSFYGGLYDNKEKIFEELEKEENKFRKTLENPKGREALKKIFNSAIGGIDPDEPRGNIFINNTMRIDGRELFRIYETFGLPIEISQEIMTDWGVAFDEQTMEEAEEAFKKHQELSRTASVGMFKGGLADTSEETKKYHTAAHLMLAALRKVLGEGVFQKGSNITAERLRFDFSHPEKLTDEQKQEVERLVNEAIEKDLPVVCDEMSLDEAKKQGAMGVFESKYGEKVKVYTIGEISKEICGGPHVNHTGELGKFKIQKEESSSAGVRRIKAILE